MKTIKSPIGTMDYYREMAKDNEHIDVLVKHIDRLGKHMVRALEIMIDEQSKRIAAEKLLSQDKD